MSLLFIEGFDALSTSTGAVINTRKWYSSSPPTNRLYAGRYNGFACNCNQFLRTNSFGTSGGTAPSTYIVGFAVQMLQAIGPLGNGSIFPGGSGSGFVYFQSGMFVQCYLNINKDSKLEFIRAGAAQSTILATGTRTLTFGQWYYIEIECTISNTVGGATVHVNGIQELSVSGVDTTTHDAVALSLYPSLTSLGANNLIFATDLSQGGAITITAGTDQQLGTTSCNTSNNGFVYDDIYIATNTGSFNNTFLSERHIQTLFANGAGFSTQWTPLANANWQEVSEVAVDDDTSYNVTNTVGNIDTYSFQSTTLINISGIGIDLISRMDDAGPHTVAPVLRIGPTNFVGTNQATTSSYADLPQVYDFNPGTSAGWTQSDVNNLQAGIELGVGGSTPFDPSQLSNLFFWARADQRVYQDTSFATPAVSNGDPIGGWRDLSGNNNNVIQATNANRPILENNVVNGQPVVRFSGSQWVLTTTSTLPVQTNNNFSMFVVFAAAAASGEAFGMGDNAQTGARAALFIDATPLITFDGDGEGANGPAATLNTFFLSEFIYTGGLFNSSSFTMYVNGVLQTPTFTGPSNSLVPTVPGIAVGTITGAPNNANFNGDVAEVVVYLRAVSTAERQQLESYFNTRYGV